MCRVFCVYRLGARRRMCVAMALLGEPRVVLLDEPTAGMDPEDAAQVWHLLQAYAQHPGSFTVVAALSRIQEAATFCDRMGILIGGTLSWCGRPEDLQERFQCAFDVTLKVLPLLLTLLLSICF